MNSSGQPWPIFLHDTFKNKLNWNTAREFSFVDFIYLCKSLVSSQAVFSEKPSIKARALHQNLGNLHMRLLHGFVPPSIGGTLQHIYFPDNGAGHQSPNPSIAFGLHVARPATWLQASSAKGLRWR